MLLVKERWYKMLRSELLRFCIYRSEPCRLRLMSQSESIEQPKLGTFKSTTRLHDIMYKLPGDFRKSSGSVLKHVNCIAIQALAHEDDFTAVMII